MTTEVARTVESLREAAIDLAWSLWAECGVSTWGRRHHADWAVELEPLLALTALLAPHEPRLMREAVDWCVKNERFISLTQFRHVVTAERWPFKGPIGIFGATVGRHSGKQWPGAATEAVRAISLSGKSQAPDLGRPALLQLRLRALFGVSGRAEIIRAMVVRSTEWSVKQIADRVAYTRRQVQFDLEMLVASGIVYRSPGASPATYALSDHKGFVRIIKNIPPYAPHWAPVFRVVTGMLDAFEQSTSMTAPSAELRRQVRYLEPSIERAGLIVAAPEAQHDYVGTVMRWMLETLGSLADGEPKALRPERIMSATFNAPEGHPSVTATDPKPPGELARDG